MSTRNRLELTWVGKDQRPRLEPRILLEDPAMSYHAPARRGDADQFDNLLIHGDNLLALKALEAEYAGKVKCIFIDPPYNTGSAFTHYDDGLEHSLWLTMMRDRLLILRSLLREDGSIWITIDDNEMAYLRVLLDEIFGRQQFIAQCVWQKVYSPKSSAKFISDSHDYVICYAKDVGQFSINLLPRGEKQDKAYKNPDRDPRGKWKAGDLSARNYYSEGRYAIVTPSGRVIDGPPQGMYWRVSKSKLDELNRDGRIWWGSSGSNVPAIKRFLTEVKDGIVPQTWWTYDEVGHNQSSKQHLKRILPDESELFITPKPEELIARVLVLATGVGDLVLDSFSGSGTTGAVAHKMGRRWIMVELGEHAKTHIIPRLRKVIDGTDPGGVTETCGWKGGGGYRFMRLAPSLMQRNAFGHWVISHDYNAEMLAEAVCKHLGFHYQPRPEFWWMMGRSTERDFICVTTASLTHEELRAISDEVGSERTLLICCKAFMARTDAFENLTVQKIPQTILHRCEWGRDDYSLRVAALPEAPTESAHEPSPAVRTSSAKTDVGTGDLFAAKEKDA